MTQPFFRSGRWTRLEARTIRIATFASLLTVFAIIAALTYLQLARNDRANQAIIATTTLRNDVEQAFLLVQGAEAAQRGYLLTGQAKYLAPFHGARDALPAILARLSRAGSGLDQREVRLLEDAVGHKMADSPEPSHWARRGAPRKPPTWWPRASAIR